jgi:hypothetical protein
LSYWIYKCNSQNRPHQVAYGDWNDFFADGSASKWGSTEWVPALASASVSDTILAYQTDRNELAGVAKVVRWRRRGEHSDLILEPLQQLKVKVRPLKKKSSQIASIPALQPGPVRTLYAINAEDANCLLRAAGAQIRLEAKESNNAVRHAIWNGAGFGTPEKNKEVEASAMKHLSKHLKARGWKVNDVSLRKLGYDLHCTRGRSTMHVECKGIAGSRLSFIITRAEQKQWQTNPSFVLGVVTNARSKNPQVDLFRGKRSLSRFRFEPLSFMAIGEVSR